MKVILGAIAVLVVMLLGATLVAVTPVMAASVWKAAYDLGVSDANNKNPRGWYILQPGKGFQFHTMEFVTGYIDGFCSVAGPHFSSDSDKATWDCARGPISASWVSEK